MHARTCRGPGRIRYGLKPDPEIRNPQDAIVRANRASVKRFLPKLMDHVRQGILDPESMITRRMPLGELSDACRILSEKPDGRIKTLLLPSPAGA